MTSLFENLKMKGGGNRNPGCPNDVHFKLHKISRGRSQKHSFFGLNLLTMPQISQLTSLGLWTEWLKTPIQFGPPKTEGTPDQINTWMEQLNQFMKQFNSQTLVFRIQAPEIGKWTSSINYNDWKQYWALDNGAFDKLYDNINTLKEIHFLPYINIEYDSNGNKLTTKQQAADQYSFAYDFIYNNISDLTPTNNAIKKYICIEPENINDGSGNVIVDNTYLNNPTAANNEAKLTAMAVKSIKTNSTNYPNLKLSYVGAPTLGKSQNLVKFTEKQFGEWYSDTDIDGASPTFYNQSVNQIMQQWQNSIKIGDTNVDNYMAMLSIETNYFRRPNFSGGYQLPKFVATTARLGPEPQQKTIELAKSIYKAYELKNEVIIYSGEFLEQWGLTEPDASLICQNVPSSITLNASI